MKNEYKEELFLVLWFVIWSLIYAGLYLVLSELLPIIFKNTSFFQVSFLSILVIGLCFSFLSRIIYSLIKKKRIYIDSGVFFFWTFSYGFSIWFFEFLRNYFIDIQNLSFLTNTFLGSIFIGIGVSLFIKIIQKMDFGIRGPRGIRAPSQIFTGVVLIIFGILSWRFSTIVFIKWFNWTEGVAWSWLIGLGLIIAGALVLIAWWRNNVANFNFHGHWWNH